MKTQLHSPLALALLALLLALPGLRAATATPPDKMTYQGFLVDANGVALGNTAPVNHTVEFRIYDASSGGTIKWGEVQTVTVDKGYFSVLLGDGTTLAGAPTGPLASTVFQGSDVSDRYISVKVTSGALAGSAEILPRLRLVTSPYAYMATTLPAGAITNGLFAAASITGDKLATNTLTAANFSTNVGLWTANGTNIFRTNGNVGIGTATPGAPLDVLGQMQVLANGTIQSHGSKNTFRGMIETSYGPGNDRYGLAQGPGGNLALYTAQNVGTIQFGKATGADSFSPQMTILNNGNVGIGTPSPLVPLHVYGNAAGGAGHAVFQNGAAGEAFSYLALANDAGAHGVIFKNSSTRSADGGPNTMTVRNDGGDLRLHSAGGLGIWVKATTGRVGIGTTTPASGLQVETVGSVSAGSWSYLNRGDFNTGSFGGSPNLAIYTSSAIGATTFYVFSDARIKNVLGVSSGTKDLNTLRAIEVTDYTYKDPVANGSRRAKMVIAQQVESVYPQAVSQTTGVVPDIFKEATQQDGWVMLATDLKAGERVKLVSEGGQGVYEVLEVRKDGFRTALKPATDKVFVVGREVADFRNVDYSALSMLNVSATQELARKLDAQETELTELRAELAKLRGERKTLAENISNLEAGFARLEKAMSKRTGVIEARATTGDVIGASK